LARPATTPVKLKAGYYIELRRQGENKGVKIRSENVAQLHESIKRYKGYYNVIYYGEVKNGKVINTELPERK